MVAGGTYTAAGGAAVSLSGVGASVGVPAMVAGGATVVVGGFVVNNALKNLQLQAEDVTHQTYTKKNETTGETYSGRTSGTGTAEENVANRNSGHHMNDKGFGKAKLDKSSPNPDAIRGREQQLIDANGGAKSTGSNSGNKINGVGAKNPKKDQYMEAAKKLK